MQKALTMKNPDITSLDTSYQAEGFGHPQNASEVPGTSNIRVAQLFLNDRYFLKRVDIYPHLRSSYTDSGGATENIKLRRQIKGFLNRY
jgi:hypothetical protein